MILRGARVAHSPARADIADIEIVLGRIRTLGRAAGISALDFSGCLILPGLVNAQESLDDAGLIRSGIRNLACGVTTVCYHGPWNPVFDHGFPVRVARRFSAGHGVRDGDLLDELRTGRDVFGLSEERLYAMVTSTAADLLRLVNGEGSICQNGVADFVVYEDDGLTPAETLFRQLPRAVFIRGRAQLATEQFALTWERCFPQIARFQRLSMEGRGPLRVRCRLPGMTEELLLAGYHTALTSQELHEHP
jgi:hypothetical protein